MARSLERKAANEDTSVNALAGSILGEHLGWNKKAKEFGLVSIHPAIFMSPFEELDNETLTRIGREVVTAAWKEMAEFWLQDSSPDKVLEVLAMKSRTDPARLMKVTKEEGPYTIVFRHDFGPKWSIVLKSALQEFVRKSYHVEPRISAEDSVVTARFDANLGNSLI